MLCDGLVVRLLQPSERGALPSEGNQGDEWDAYVTLDAYGRDERGITPQGASPEDDGVLVVVVAAPRGAMRKEMKDIKDLIRAG